MLTINFANDLINPPELLHLPTASNYIKVMIPSGSATYGHMTLAHPAVLASALGLSYSASRTSADKHSISSQIRAIRTRPVRSLQAGVLRQGAKLLFPHQL
jgi:hypothetical protein